MQKGKVIGDEGCPKCTAQGRDSTQNHLMIFDNGTKYCNRCGHFVPAEDGKEEYEEGMTDFWLESLEDVQEYSSYPHEDRKIRQDVTEVAGIKSAFCSVYGHPIRRYYPVHQAGNLVGYKIRRYWTEEDKEVTKKPQLLGTFKCFKGKVGDVDGNMDLFGEWTVSGSRRKLVVVEGEEDWCAAYQMLLDYTKSRHGDKYTPNVVSLPTGATMTKDGKGVIDRAVINKKELFDTFEEVIMCLDQDEPGDAVTRAFSEWLGPEKVKHMIISEKDPCDMLKGEKDGEFIDAFFSADVYKPKGLVTLMEPEIFKKAVALPEMGKPWPWPSLTKLTYGRRIGDGYYIGAGKHLMLAINRVNSVELLT